MLPAFIAQASDLVTPRAATVEGFLEQARKKAAIAAPIVAEAMIFRQALQVASAEQDLRDMLQQEQTRNALIGAAGLSGKASAYLSQEELQEAVLAVLNDLIEVDARGQRLLRTGFRDELLYRYLLTKGDSLGGMMRNLVGNMAEQKFAAFIITTLKTRGFTPELRYSNAGHVNSIGWGNRLALFNVTPKFIKKNVDLLLLAADAAPEDGRRLQHEPGAFMACGELKGGIDPAGADEHWKTARSALNRIREKFSRMNHACPPLFFAGAAIAPAMADEIFSELKSGLLSHAANLTRNVQVQDLIDWLLSR